MKKQYDFPVKLEHIYTDSALSKGPGEAISGRRAVVRQDDRKVLGIVSDKYQLVEHKDVIETFRKALKGTEHVENISVVKNGAQLLAEYTLSGVTMPVKTGDNVSMKFIVRNSYNGSHALEILFGAYRLVCSNGMIIGKSIFTYAHKHIGNSSALDVTEVSEKVEELTQLFKKTLPKMQEMSRVKLSIPRDSLFDQKRINLPKYLLKIAEDEYIKESDPTLWDYYNSLTYAITHRMKKENPIVSPYYSQYAWDAATLLIGKGE